MQPIWFNQVENASTPSPANVGWSCNVAATAAEKSLQAYHKNCHKLH
jgi:hypothetical protein